MAACWCVLCLCNHGDGTEAGLWGSLHLWPREEGDGAEKVSQLTQWPSKRPVLRMKGDKLRGLVRAPRRKYSIPLSHSLRTQIACRLQTADEEFQILANCRQCARAFTNRTFCCYGGFFFFFLKALMYLRC